MLCGLAFVGQLAVLLGIEQHALGRNADPDQTEVGILETLGAGGGPHARQAVQALFPAQCDVLVVRLVMVDRDLVTEFATVFGGLVVGGSSSWTAGMVNSGAALTSGILCVGRFFATGFFASVFFGSAASAGTAAREQAAVAMPRASRVLEIRVAIR